MEKDYKLLIKELVNCSEQDADMILYEVDRMSRLTILSKHPFLFHGLLAVLSNLLYPLFELRRRVPALDVDFIFVSCPDPIFRTKTIPLIAGEMNYGIIYLPNFHVKSAIDYHLFFRKEGVSTFFPTISIKSVFKAKRIVDKLKKRCVDSGYNSETKKVISVLSSYLIYDDVARRIISRISPFHGKVILEHEKFYFIPMVVNIHQSGMICTMLQHGCFVEVDDFMPLFSDKVLCCSERERRAYISRGIKPENVITFGAPLQTLAKDGKYDISKRKRYSILLLLTQVTDDSKNYMQAVLTYVKENNISVLVRLRPRSRNNDIEKLNKELEGLDISKKKSSLVEDLMCCDKVISFSEDANIEIIKQNKPFVYFYPWTSEEKTLRRDLPYATMDNYKEEIRKLIELDFYSTISKDQYKEIVGETSIDVLRERFEEFVKRKN